jgi:hypothetical protein
MKSFLRPTCLATFALALFVSSEGIARSPGLTDDAIRQQVIQESVAAYLATGHPCACPYNAARNGSSCGGRSAYSRRGGASPICYPSDVTDQMVDEWKRTHLRQ